MERPLFYRFPFFSLKKIIFSFFLTGRLKGSVFSFISPFPQNRPVLKMLFSCSLRMPCLLFYTFFLFLQYLSSFFAIFRHFSPHIFPFPFPFLALKYPLKSLETPLPLSSIPSAPKIPGNPILHKIG